MQCNSFTGRVYSELVEGGHAEVDIEFTRSGISAMAPAGQVFEIPFSRCELQFGGVGRRLVLCRTSDRTLTICCRDPAFPRVLGEAARGLLDMQLERRFKDGSRSPDHGLQGLNVLVGIAMVVAAAYLIVRI